MNTLTEKTTSAAPMHIAMVTETYPPEINGVAVTLRQFVEGMLHRGHSVHLVRPRQHIEDHDAEEGRLTVSVTRGMPLPGYPGLRLGLPSKGMLVKHWTQRRPDIVHIATEGPLGSSALAAARKLCIPVSTDFHTNFHSYTKHYGIGLLMKPMAAWLRRFHNKADCTIVPTVTLQRELEQASYKNVLVAARGVDTKLFHPGRRSQALRASWGVADDTPVALLVSRLAPEKNLPAVIEAFEAMRAVNPAARLVMVGDGPARAALEKRHHPYVIFVGMRTGKDLAAHYASADIFLYPSLTETFGNVTIEAMSSGLATLAFDYAAAHQHIRHGVNGLLLPYGDTGAFVEQAKLLVNDTERIHKLRTEARHTVEQLTWERIMEQMENVFRGIIETRGAEDVQAEISPATD